MINNNTSMKKLISRIIQVATLVASFLISSLRCPTSLINWPKVVIVAVYVIVILFVRPNSKWKKYLVVILLFGLFFGFFYWVVFDSRAITIDGQTYVRGDQLTKSAKVYLGEHPSVTEKEYFLWMGKKQSEIWTPESLVKNKFIMGGLYFLFIGLVGFGILGGLEIIVRSSSSRSKSVSTETSKNQKTSKKKLGEK